MMFILADVRLTENENIFIAFHPLFLTPLAFSRMIVGQITC